MTKKLVLTAMTFGIAALLSILVFVMSPDRCQEKAFQQSPLFGQVPRRYFNIATFPPTQWSDLISTTYAVLLPCEPNLILRASKFTCTLEEAREAHDSERSLVAEFSEACRTQNAP